MGARYNGGPYPLIIELRFVVIIICHFLVFVVIPTCIVLQGVTITVDILLLYTHGVILDELTANLHD